MILSMSRQAWLFLMTAGAGAAIGFIYDAFRIIRKTAPHAGVIIQAEDLIFWLGVTLLMFYFMLSQNYGEIRFFSIIGAAAGAALYFATLSRLVMAVSVAAVNFIKRVVRTTLRILFAPFRLIIGLLAPPARYIGAFARKGLRLMARYVKIKARGAAKSFSIMRKKV